MSDVFEKIKEIIHTQLGIDKKIVTPDANFIDDLGADTIDAVELIVNIENEFGIDIPENQVFIKIIDIVKYIESKI